MTQDQLLSALKKDVRSLLISAKRGLAPDQLKRDYENMLGHPMPLRALGFRNVLDMVKEMPDAVHLDYARDGSIVLKAIGDEATKGIKELVAKQRDHKPKPSIKRGTFSSSSSRHPHHHYPLIFPPRGHFPSALPAQLRTQLRQVLSHGPVGLSELEARYAVCFGRPLNVMNYGFFSIAEMVAASSDLIAVRQTRAGSQLFLKTKLTPIKQVPTPPATPFPVQPTRTPNIRPVLKENTAFNNIKTKVEESPKEETSVRPAPAASLPQPVKEKQSFEKSIAKLEEQFRQRIFENGDAGTVSQELKDKLRKVVAGHSQGMAIHKLPIEYKKMYGEDLPVAQCGFLNVTEMVGALSDTFYLKPVPEEGTNNLLILELKDNDTETGDEECQSSLNPSSKGYYFSCSKSAWEQEEEGGEAVESSESDTEIRITNKTIHQMVDIFPVTMVSRGSWVPLDVVLCQKLKPPICRKERELVPILVVKTESPSLFYVQFDENQEARTLENMMIEMRSCYMCPEITERYRLPEVYIRPGQVCCVAPGNIWFYRVVIHQVLSDTEVEVYYVDFGDLTTVNRNSLLFLKSCYAELPAQAVPSVLAGVKPIKSVWTKEAISTFQKLCLERTLVAAVHSYQNDFLLLFLCDTHTEEDIYIHSALQAEGHAIACSPGSTPVLRQLNPITLYLGEGLLEDPSLGVTKRQNPNDQPQREPATILTDGLEKQQPSKDTKDFPDLPLPPLEFINVSQGEKANPFDALLNEDSASCCNWDSGWTDKSTADDDKLKPVQNCQKDPASEELHLGAHQKAVALSTALSVRPASETQPTPVHVWETKQLQPSVSTLQTLSLHTPGLIHNCRRQTELFPPPPTGILFPVFNIGARLVPDALFMHHASPLSRMAAGSHLLHWYPHKRA